jgi:hypothetical protein
VASDLRAGGLVDRTASLGTYRAASRIFTSWNQTAARLRQIAVVRAGA